MKKPTKRDTINLFFSAFLIIAFIVCAHFFSQYASALSQPLGSIIPILVYAVFGLLPLKFGDEFSVEVSLVFFTGSRMIFDYKLFNNKNGELSATGRTTHCFATPELKPISIKHSNSDYYNRLRDNIVDTEDVTIKR